MRRWLRQLHQDSSGAISVLVLLTIWCFVALIAMLWNTAEFSVRRQHIQNAADSAAHAAAMWQARTLNAVSAQNMVICQDASAEAIWRASITAGGNPGGIPPADPAYPNSGSLYGELAKERADAVAGVSRVRGLQQQLQALTIRLEAEYAMTSSALQTLATSLAGSSGGGANTQPATQPKSPLADLANKVRQAQSALDWVENTYLNGQPPSVAGRPGPPGPNGEGLYQLVDEWNIPPATERKIFDLIINYIDTIEMPIVRNFQQQVMPATAEPLDVRLSVPVPADSNDPLPHEQVVFNQQQSERENVSQAIETQRAAIADYYHADVKLATIKPATDPDAQPDDLGTADSQTVSAPVIEANKVSSYYLSDADGGFTNMHTDLIRQKYPVDAANHNPPLPVQFEIDPINPHTVAHQAMTGSAHQGDWDDATIWHPDILIPISSTASFKVNCNIAGGWGHVWLMPIERYLSDRIGNDMQRLNAFMVQLDNERNNNPSRPDLMRQIYALQNLPLNPQIAALPSSVIDNVKNAQGGYDQIPVLPNLKNPPNTTGPIAQQIQLYNMQSGLYMADVRQLRGLLLLYQTAYVEFYISFAQLRWLGAVNNARDAVMGLHSLPPNDPPVMGLAQNGYFMTLSTYKLRMIPGWARQSMHDAVQQQVGDWIIETNIVALVRALGGNSRFQARLMAPDALSTLTTYVMAPGGPADEIADEWVNRPWPYEIAPPGTHTPATTDDNDNTTPPPFVPTGLTKDDRQQFFSVVAVATDNDKPRPLLPLIYGDATSLTAYAQSEAFNWMEFNSDYGGSQQFDVPTRALYYLGQIWNFAQIGCPRQWRMGSKGGWNWQSRLAVSDALPQAAQLNPDLQDALQQAGITNTDEATFNAINAH